MLRLTRCELPSRPGDDFDDGEFWKWGERCALARNGLSGEVDTSTDRCRSRVSPLAADCRDEGRRGSRREAEAERDVGADTRPPIRVCCGEGPFIMDRRMLPRDGANDMALKAIPTPCGPPVCGKQITDVLSSSRVFFVSAGRHEHVSDDHSLDSRVACRSNVPSRGASGGRLPRRVGAAVVGADGGCILFCLPPCPGSPLAALRNSTARAPLPGAPTGAGLPGAWIERARGLR